MDLELIFWTVAGGLTFLVLLLAITVGRTTPEEVQGIPISEKNVDDMEDKWE